MFFQRGIRVSPGGNQRSESCLSPDFEDRLGVMRSEYSNKGFAVLTDVFSSEEVRKLRAAALIALSQAEQISKYYKHSALEVTTRSGFPSPALLFWPRLVNPVINEFSTDARLAKIVGTFLGPNVKQLNNQFYYRLQGDGDEFSWHQDIMFRHPRSDYPGIVEADGYLQTAILVDDFTEDNAPVVFVEGSHKFGDLKIHEDGDTSLLRHHAKVTLPKSIEGLKRSPLLGKSGSVAVWSSLSVHSSENNISSSARFYLMNGFARAENVKPWPWYLKDGQLQQCESRLIP